MFRILQVLSGVFLVSALLVGGAFGFETIFVNSSGAKTASANILATAGYFYGIQADQTAGSGSSSFVVYDEAGTATSGEAIFRWTYPITAGSRIGPPMFDPPIAVDNGVFVAQSVSAGTWTWQGYTRAR